MCGRYVITKPIDKTVKIVKSTTTVKNDENFNAHPSQSLPIIKLYSNGKALELVKWGIVPSWAKQKDFRPLINARMETIDEKVSFKRLIKTTRCVAVMDGYYEWKRSKKSKIPFYFMREDKKPLYIAGIFENNEFCLITEEASQKIVDIQDRQPVVLDSDEINNYLDLKKDGKKYLSQIKKISLNYHEISKDVNKPTNNYPSLISKLN